MTTRNCVSSPYRRQGELCVVTEAEHQSIAARYGWTMNLVIHMDVLRGRSRPEAMIAFRTIEQEDANNVSSYLIMATLQLEISQHGQRLSQATAHEWELARTLGGIVNDLLLRDAEARDVLWRAAAGHGSFSGTMSSSVRSTVEQQA